MKRLRKSLGTAPGTLCHTGDGGTGKPSLSLYRYNEAGFDRRTPPNFQECAGYRQKGRVLWIDVDGVHDADLVAEAGRVFGLHPLTMEDILHTHQRPKLEEFDNYLFLQLKGLSLDPAGNAVLEEQVAVVVGEEFVLTFREKPGPVFQAIRERVENHGTNLRRRGADYLAYALTDAVVDNYFTVLEQFEEHLEELDERLLEGDGATLQAMYHLKKELIVLRRSVWPLREIINSIGRDQYRLIDAASTRPFFRDLYDNVILAIETVESYRDIVIGMYDTALAVANNRMNEVMKVLTIIATTFMPLSFIAGIYGMNFHHMPELEWRWGYYAVLGTMLSIFIGMVLYFRSRKWV